MHLEHSATNLIPANMHTTTISHNDSPILDMLTPVSQFGDPNSFMNTNSVNTEFKSVREQFSGTVEKILFKEGDNINSGDVLIIIKKDEKWI